MSNCSLVVLAALVSACLMVQLVSADTRKCDADTLNIYIKQIDDSFLYVMEPNLYYDTYVKYNEDGTLKVYDFSMNEAEDIIIKSVTGNYNFGRNHMQASGRFASACEKILNSFGTCVEQLSKGEIKVPGLDNRGFQAVVMTSMCKTVDQHQAQLRSIMRGIRFG